MKLIIDIPEEMYKVIKDGMWCGTHMVGHAIDHGLSLDNMSNGEVMDKLFPEESEMLYDNVFTEVWWNRPYRKGDHE